MTHNTVFKTGGKRPPERFKTIDLGEGEWIFREDDLGMEMFIIQEGQVEILKRVGEEDHLISVLDKGDFFGEMALLENLPRAAGARAVSAVKLLEIDGSTFDQMLRANPEIAVRMMRKLSRRLRETDALIQELGGQSWTARETAEPPERRAESIGPERLVHPQSGMEFPLSRAAETTIGRKDPVTGIYPDIDLVPVDGQRSISRRHAKIHRRGEKLFLAEEIGTMNGTYLNGERLETGVPVEIGPGDELRFGVIDTVFRLD